MKKAISVLLAALMVITVMPMTVFADEREVDSIQFEPANADKVIYEYADGYIVDDYTYGEWWCYNVPSFEEGDELTLNFAEGQPEVYYYDTTEAHGYGAFVNTDTGYELDSSYDARTVYKYEQSYDHQLTYGQYTYAVAIGASESYREAEQTFTFAPNPVTSIELDFAPITITEGGDTYRRYDYDAGEYYDCYRFDYMNVGNRIILHTADDDIVFTCQYVKNNYGYDVPEFVDEDGNIVDQTKFSYDDHQSYTNKWEGGNTYKVDFTYLKHYTATFDVTVAEKPNGIEVLGYAGNGSAMQNTGGYMSSGHYRYIVPSLASEGVTLTVQYEKAEDVVYTAQLKHNDLYDYDYWAFVDGEGTELPEYILTVDGQDETPWGIGEHTYHFEVYGIATPDYTFTVTEAPNDFEITGYDSGSAMENTNGYWKTDDNNEQYFYYWTPSLFEDGVAITLKYANSPDATYYAQGTYHPNGDYTEWKWVDSQGNELNANVRVMDGQDSNHWTVGNNTYYIEVGNLSKAYTFTVLEGPYDVQITGFNGNGFAIENTNGQWEVDDDEQDYYAYWVPSIYEEGVTVTFKYHNQDDVVYHMADVDDDGSFDEFVDANGNPANVSIYMESNQREDHWKVGNNTYYVVAGSFRIPYNFFIHPAPTSATFEFAEGTSTTFTENQGGYYEGETYVYDLPNIYEPGNKFTLNFPEGYESQVFTCERYEDPNYPGQPSTDFFAKDGTRFEDWIRYPNDFDQEETPFTIGENTVPIEIGDAATANVTFTVLSGPESIDFTLAQPYSVTQNTHGSYRVDANENEYYHYNYENELLSQVGNTLVAHYDDARGDVTYVATEIDHGDGFVDIQFVNQNDASDSFLPWTLECTDTQYANHWGVGSHQINVLYGGRSATATVTVTGNDVTGLLFQYKNGNPTFFEGENMIERYADPSAPPVQVYDLNYAVLQIGNKLTVIYNGGTAQERREVYTCDFDPNEESSLWFFTADGKALNRNDFTIIDDQDMAPWGVGAHSFSVGYMGAFAEAQIILATRNGWKQDGDDWYYFVNGEPVTGMQDIKGKRYCFDEDGVMYCGLFKITYDDGYYNWYFTDRNGALQENFQTIDGKLYFFYPGEYFMVFNTFADINGKTYYLQESGAAKGWKQIEGNWYFFNSDCSMRKGWLKSGGKWYYFDSTGKMLKSWQKISNKWYYLGTDGAMVTSWQKISNKWYYFGTDGIMVTGWQKISNKWYLFNSGGAMLTGWQKSGSAWYYFNASGVMQTGWLKSGGKWYYFESSGKMLANTSKKIGSKTYKFNASGVCLNP